MGFMNGKLIWKTATKVLNLVRYSEAKASALMKKPYRRALQKSLTEVPYRSALQKCLTGRIKYPRRSDH